MNSGGEVLTIGEKGDIQFPFGFQLDGWNMYGAPTGSIRVDLLRGTYSNYPFTTGSQMHIGSTGPFITNGVKQQDLTLSDWAGMTGAAGDIITVDVKEILNLTRATLTLTYHKL
jgi:hypothetical protein